MSYHRDTEHALDRIESALCDAQHALSCMTDDENVEDEVGEIADALRDCHSDAEELLTTDLEDAEQAIRYLIAKLSDLCTTASDLYNRL
jgi:hypothetical protein